MNRLQNFAILYGIYYDFSFICLVCLSEQSFFLFFSNFIFICHMLSIIRKRSYNSSFYIVSWHPEPLHSTAVERWYPTLDCKPQSTDVVSFVSTEPNTMFGPQYQAFIMGRNEILLINKYESI